jgi:hypothetical protein
LIDWLVDWLIDSLDWCVDRLVDWLIGSSTVMLMHGPVYIVAFVCVVCLLVCLFVCLIDRLMSSDLLFDWFVACVLVAWVFHSVCVVSAIYCFIVYFNCSCCFIM